MDALQRPWGVMHYTVSGPSTGPAVLCLHALGTDLRMWDGVIARLPGQRTIRFDLRGHGLSGTLPGAWDIADLADDAIALLDVLGIGRAAILGCSVGGMVAQTVAARCPDRMAGLILSNTAARIGSAESWQARIDGVMSQGLAAMAPAILERWFGADFRARPEAALWAEMLARSDPAGYVGTCAALARADLTAGLAAITAPTLGIAGRNDAATPPGQVADMIDRIAGARLVVLEGSGHLPAIDAPEATARLVAAFLKEIGHD